MQHNSSATASLAGSGSIVHMKHGQNSRSLQGEEEEEANSGPFQLSFTDDSLDLSLEQVGKQVKK
jgi:hypothetical protein